MSYSGYRIKIGATTIKNNMMAPDTWNVIKHERVIYTWKDANQVEHREIAPDKKVEINFSIRERTMSEQATLAPVFQTLTNLTVEYWDDILQQYVQKTCYMDPPTIQSRSFGAELLYDETAIHLTEY